MLVIGITGGSGSGKTTVVQRIAEAFHHELLTVVPQDAYYRDHGDLSEEEKKLINFDHPDSIEFPLLVEQLDRLRHSEAVEMPIYSYLTCARSKETRTVKPGQVIIVEGILILTDEELRKRLDIKVFVDADPDERLMRIIRRDIMERGRSYADVLRHYEAFVKPMHLQFIEPTKRYADIIVPQGGRNHVAIDLLTSRVKLNLG
jgi:uridine kinase